MEKRVVITAMGMVSPLGDTPEAVMDSFREDRVSFRSADFDPEVSISPVREFDLKAHTGRYKNARYLCRGAALGVAAATMAVKASGLCQEEMAQAGLFTGAGPNFDIGGEVPEIASGAIDEGRLSALFILKFLPNTAAAAISQLTGVRGENSVVGTACSASLQAIGEAYRRVRSGYLPMALAGGGDSRLSPGGILAYRKAGALHTGMGDPAKEYAPFNEGPKGFLPGEGGAFFLLEELSCALERGARILCEIKGFSTSMDGWNMTAPDPSGKWAEVAVRGAMAEAEIPPEAIDAVAAHGTGTPLNDAMESAMLHRVFGPVERESTVPESAERKPAPRGPAVLALKSWIGHLSSACGAVELGLSLALMQNGYLPPVRNLVSPCNGEVNFVREETNRPFDTLLLENFGFGGQNCALVVKRWKA